MDMISQQSNDLFVDPKAISPRAGKTPLKTVTGVSIVQILPEGHKLYGLYPEDFPSVLQGRLKDIEWKEVVRHLNSLWTPLVDENKKLFSGNLLAYTVLAIPVHLAKEHKFRHHEAQVMKEMASYLDQVNKRYADKNIAILFRKEEAHDDLPTAFFIEIRRE